MNITIRKFIIDNFLKIAATTICAALLLWAFGIIPHTPRHHAQPHPSTIATEHHTAVKCEHCDSCGELYPIDELVRIPYEKGEGGSICPSCADYWTFECQYLQNLSVNTITKQSRYTNPRARFVRALRCILPYCAIRQSGKPKAKAKAKAKQTQTTQGNQE